MLPRVTRLVVLLLCLVACGSKTAAPASVATSEPVAVPAPDPMPIDAGPADATTADTSDASTSRDEVIALARFGYLTIEANRVTKIYVDARLIGETPLVRLPLAPGPHKVKLVGPGKQTKQIEIVIEGGKDIEETITW
jgi:hypothetical protein